MGVGLYWLDRFGNNIIINALGCQEECQASATRKAHGTQMQAQRCRAAGKESEPGEDCNAGGWCKFKDGVDATNS